MTEAEWLNATDPVPMLMFVEDLHPRPTTRKLRLLACACCRAVWDVSWPTSCRNAVLAAEDYSDQLLSAKHLNEARSKACQAAQNHGRRLHRARTRSHQAELLHSRITLAANTASGDVHFEEYTQYSLMYHSQTNPRFPDEAVMNSLSTFLRDIFGNPFRPVILDPRWLSETVVALATGVYTERAFDRMPILADALEDAGRDQADILAHCRGDGPHVRGCWVVDLILGKS